MTRHCLSEERQRLRTRQIRRCSASLGEKGGHAWRAGARRNCAGRETWKKARRSVEKRCLACDSGPNGRQARRKSCLGSRLTGCAAWRESDERSTTALVVASCANALTSYGMRSMLANVGNPEHGVSTERSVGSERWVSRRCGAVRCGRNER